ncbi:hypothetical protein CEXT_25511 [Caerostris extrusa]|uniref:Uncharacterized protein n=1 Tax=Caerostris extrusa TaxID=172846 RepID=A0AAV4VXX4_CAEEX|nr:hypothetical protein CEXT_25511 [Caerostris extrusa]
MWGIERLISICSFKDQGSVRPLLWDEDGIIAEDLDSGLLGGRGREIGTRIFQISRWDWGLERAPRNPNPHDDPTEVSHTKHKTQNPTLSSLPSLLCRIKGFPPSESSLSLSRNRENRSVEKGGAQTTCLGKDGGIGEIDFDLLFKDQKEVSDLLVG